MTLKNGASVVYDNNGIEDKSGASFYSNPGGGADNLKPGLVNLYSMSNYFPLDLFDIHEVRTARYRH